MDIAEIGRRNDRLEVWHRLPTTESKKITVYRACATFLLRCYIIRWKRALAVQAIPPIPTYFSVAWSVCLSHPGSLLKSFNDLDAIWQVGPTLVSSSDTLC